MSNLFDLPPEEFSFYLEEGQYTPERRRELIEGYNAAFAARNARPPVPEGRALSRDVGLLENARRLGYSALDNLIGFDDDYETTGERFGRGIRETIDATRSDPLAVLGLVSEGIGDSYRRAATLPSLDQIRAGEAPGAVDALGFAAIPAAPALGAARAANVLSANPVGRDVAGFTQTLGPRPAASTPDDFGYYQDNPALTLSGGEEWLAYKQKVADDTYARRSGITGSTTATLGQRAEMFLPTDFLRRIPGLLNERRVSGEAQYDALLRNVQEKGFLPDQGGNKVLLGVNHRGEPFLIEGNTRVAVASDVGVPSVRAEVHYFNGGEMVEGQFAPENVAGIASLTPRAAALPSEGIRVFHASPQEIEGDFRLSNTDVGVHFANNPSLAENAAVKSAFERPAAAENIRSQEFVINAKPEQIVDIPASANRFDFYDIAEALYEEGRIDQSVFNKIFDGLESIEDSTTSGASMIQEQNKFFADTLSRNTDIRALRYMNEFDAGPTWRDFEQGQTTSSVAPDYSYIVLDPKFVTRPQNYRDGGQVMMRSDMSSQMDGGIAGLSDRARDMFSRPRGVGTFAQYMNEGGSVGVSSDVIDRLRQRIIEETGTDPFDIAREEGIDPDLMLRVIQQESSGNPNAQSKKGAFGYMQLMPATAKELGVDRMDPVQNMRGGARYLRQQLDEFRTVPLALAAYNAGPTVTRRYGAIPPFKETIKYVSRITGIPFTDPSLGQTRSQAAAELGVVRPIARPADLRDPRAAQEDQILQLLQQSMQAAQPQQMQPAPQPQQNPNPISSSLRPIARPADLGVPQGAAPFAVPGQAVLPGARSVLPQSVLRPIARPTGQ
jgi:hypothetical protein